MAPARRAVLLGGLGLARGGLLGACSAGPPARSVSGSFRSRYRRAATGWTILYPPGGRRAGLPVLVALHGRGGDHTSTYRELHLDTYLAGAVRNGTRPFAIASVDGGDADYWHPRARTNPAAMVTDEFLPLLSHHGLDVRRVGLFGWSMGGYGALYLATVLRRSRVAAVVAESPAIWRHSYEVVAGSFDGPEDFRRHALWHRLDRLRGIPLRIDCGASDGFAPITRELRDDLTPPRPAGGIEPGAHDDSYWRSQAPTQLAWFGRHAG